MDYTFKMTIVRSVLGSSDVHIHIHIHIGKFFEE